MVSVLIILFKLYKCYYREPWKNFYTILPINIIKGSDVMGKKQSFRKRAAINVRKCSKQDEFSDAKTFGCFVFNRFRTYTSLSILVIGVGSMIYGIFNNQPDAWWVCTVVLAISVSALLTKNKELCSFAVGALPLYIGLAAFTPFAGSFSPLHYVNLGTILLVMYYNKGNYSPLIIVFASVFYTMWIFTFVNIVRPEFGQYDPYHKYWNWLIASIYMFFAVVTAISVKYFDKIPKWI